MRRAAAWFAGHGIARIERVLTDNALACRNSTAFAAALADIGAAHKRTRPYRPQTNGKVERFNRTPPNRMGLPTRLHRQQPAHRSSRPMAPPPQSPPTTARPSRPPAHPPSVTNATADYA